MFVRRYVLIAEQRMNSASPINNEISLNVPPERDNLLNNPRGMFKVLNSPRLS
jgi:hypothetical protein